MCNLCPQVKLGIGILGAVNITQCTGMAHYSLVTNTRKLHIETLNLKGVLAVKFEFVDRISQSNYLPLFHFQC